MELVGKTIWDPPLLIEGRDGCLPYAPLKVSDNDPPLFVMLGRKVLVWVTVPWKFGPDQ